MNIMEFVKSFNADTEHLKGKGFVPVHVTVFSDRSFEYEVLQPAKTSSIKKQSKEKGSEKPGKIEGAKPTKQQVMEIAQAKMPDLTASDMEAAIRTIKGSARSKGIRIEE